jgi:hypothetical protein
MSVCLYVCLYDCMAVGRHAGMQAWTHAGMYVYGIIDVYIRYTYMVLVSYMYIVSYMQTYLYIYLRCHTFVIHTFVCIRRYGNTHTEYRQIGHMCRSMLSTLVVLQPCVVGRQCLSKKTCQTEINAANDAARQVLGQQEWPRVDVHLSFMYISILYHYVILCMYIYIYILYRSVSLLIFLSHVQSLTYSSWSGLLTPDRKETV